MKDRNYFAKFQNFQKNVSTELEFSSQDFISLETGLQCICSNFLSLQCAIGKSIFCLLSGHGLYKANHPDNGRFTECLRTIYLYIYLYAYIYIYIYIYLYLSIYIYIPYIYAYIYLYIYLYAYIYLYIYLYAYIYFPQKKGKDRRESTDRRCCLVVFSTRMILIKRMNRIKATWRNGCFAKMDDQLDHTIPNHHPNKMDVLP